MKRFTLALIVAWAVCAPSSVLAQNQITVPHVSEAACPAEVITVAAAPAPVTVVVRKPPGNGPFPAVILLHGGLEPRPIDALKSAAMRQPTDVRFLAAGYVTVNPTFRSRRQNPQTRDALIDSLAVVEQVRKMPEVDPQSVVILGGSGGGSLALELAGETSLCAIAAGEPASVLFTGMMTEGDNRLLLQKIMDDPKSYYTPELKKFTKEKIQKTACPVLIVHGDQHAINKINHEIIIPELKAAGKKLEVIYYPNQPHGFYFGRNGSPEAAKKCFNDCDAFFKKHLATQPKALPPELVSDVPATRSQKKP
jgi:acetyl esterase/lipase